MPNAQTQNKLCLEIAVAVPVKETFSYAVPNHLVTRAEVGCRAWVPFRNRKVIGYIIEKKVVSEERGLREILDILDQEPLFTGTLVPFFQWMADYYLYPIGRLIQSALPGGLNINPFKTGRLTDTGLRVLDALPAHSEERRLLSWIRDNPGKRLSVPLGKAYVFQRKGWVDIESRTRRGVRPLQKKFVRSKDGLDLSSVLQQEAGSLRAKHELEFLETVFESNGILLEEISSKFSNGPYLVNKWINKSVLVKYTAPVLRNPAGKPVFPAPVPSALYDQQKKVLGVIQSRLKKNTFSTCLLYGVTGSGKTEVYYEAVKHTIGLGRQALLMVPEIALAVYMEGLFRSRLGSRIAIFHSGLSEGERYDEWIRMVRGEVDLVIGARSALFAPLPRLGLIIVDEEHDLSYKQEEGPRHQARDAAVVRGKLEKALVILGSGTPSVQSFHQTATGSYQLLSMPERIEKRPLPAVQTVDMKTAPEGVEKNEIMSPMLYEALEQNLAEGKQALMFLNRRGFHRVYLCRHCGRSVRCYNCDLSLVYHLRNDRLVCHACGYYTQPQDRCPACGKEGMKLYGFGTERLEQELRNAFPNCRVGRMDTDVTRRKGRIFKILKKFGQQEIDVLVGTQMIAKGYDFPNVTLVGVIAADLSLGFPDFRAGERTFQILSQVAGRAGRGDQRGRVIVQTFNPAHYAIATAKDHDFRSFFEKEMALREQLGYPPFSHLACLRLQGNNAAVTCAMAERLGRGMKGILQSWPKRGKEIQVLGPVEAPVAKLKGKYRWQILVKSKGSRLLHYFLSEMDGFARKMLKSSGVNLIMDLDPYQML